MLHKFVAVTTLSFLPLMIYHRIFDMSDMTSAISGAWTAFDHGF